MAVRGSRPADDRAEGASDVSAHVPAVETLRRDVQVPDVPGTSTSRRQTVPCTRRPRTPQTGKICSPRQGQPARDDIDLADCAGREALGSWGESQPCGERSGPGGWSNGKPGCGDAGRMDARWLDGRVGERKDTPGDPPLRAGPRCDGQSTDGNLQREIWGARRRHGTRNEEGRSTGRAGRSTSSFHAGPRVSALGPALPPRPPRGIWRQPGLGLAAGLGPAIGNMPNDVRVSIGEAEPSSFPCQGPTSPPRLRPFPQRREAMRSRGTGARGEWLAKAPIGCPRDTHHTHLCCTALSHASHGFPSRLHPSSPARPASPALMKRQGVFSVVWFVHFADRFARSARPPPPSGPKQPGYAKQPMPIFRGPHFPTAPEAFSSVPPPRRAYVNTRPSVRAFPLCPSLATDRQHDGPSKPTKRNSPGKIPVRFANPKCMHGPMRKPRSGPPRPSPPRSSASPAGPLPRSCSTTRSFVPKAKGA